MSKFSKNSCNNQKPLLDDRHYSTLPTKSHLHLGSQSFSYNRKYKKLGSRSGSKKSPNYHTYQLKKISSQTKSTPDFSSNSNSEFAWSSVGFNSPRLRTKNNAFDDTELLKFLPGHYKKYQLSNIIMNEEHDGSKIDKFQNNQPVHQPDPEESEYAEIGQPKSMIQDEYDNLNVPLPEHDTSRSSENKDKLGDFISTLPMINSGTFLGHNSAIKNRKISTTVNNNCPLTNYNNSSNFILSPKLAYLIGQQREGSPGHAGLNQQNSISDSHSHPYATSNATLSRKHSRASALNGYQNIPGA